MPDRTQAARQISTLDGSTHSGVAFLSSADEALAVADRVFEEVEDLRLEGVG